jgi:hypothetical protein
MFNYKPANDVLDQAKEILSNYAQKNGKILTENQIDVTMKSILSNVKMSPLSMKPAFPISSTINPLKEGNGVTWINIADSFKGGVFKPNKFFKTEQDLNVYLKLFGEKLPDIRTVIANTMTDLGTLVSKDNFYTKLKSMSEALIKNGERGIVYPDLLSAQEGLPNRKIPILNNGIQIESPFGKVFNDKEIYKNPINGMFSSKEFIDSITFADQMIADQVSKTLLWKIYKSIILAPKSIFQLNKTIFDPFTHVKLFTVNNLFALGNGNFFLNPYKAMQVFREDFGTKSLSAVKETFNTLQPQFLYKNLPQNQSFYNYLLRKGVVYSSATAKDLRFLMDDLERGGSKFFDKMFDRFGNNFQKIFAFSHDSYLAGDDYMKIYNYIMEYYKYRTAYSDLIKQGKISVSEVKDMVADIVANTIPNYNFVGKAVRSTRYLPIGNFPSFHSEVIRAGYNTIELALKEIANPVTRSIGYKRLAGFAMTTSVALPVIGEIARGFTGVTNEQNSAARKFVPPYAQGSNLIVWYDRDKGFFKYINTSEGFVYDALANPAISALASAESDAVFKPNSTIKESIERSLFNTLAKAINPYLDDSIYWKTLVTLNKRNGVTEEGQKVWNPQDTRGDKFVKGAAYALKEASPFGIQKAQRIYKGLANEPGPTGQKYDPLNEMGVAFGFRGQQIEPLKSMPFEITKFKEKIKDANAIFSSTPNYVPTQKDYILNYIKANAATFNAIKELNELRQASLMLYTSPGALRKEFIQRQENKIYSSMLRNRYDPIPITSSEQKEAKEKYKQIEMNFENLEYPEPFDNQTKAILRNLHQRMRYIPYDGNFYDYIKPEDYIPKNNDQSSLQTPVNNKQVFNIAPVNTPNVNSQTVTPNPQQTSATQNEFQRAFPQG